MSNPTLERRPITFFERGTPKIESLPQLTSHLEQRMSLLLNLLAAQSSRHGHARVFRGTPHKEYIGWEKIESGQARSLL